eukprot:CAMPEP_0178991398 /NCGR_PEP_ID=MMETSP0795-20121207/5505_1 /TAXON_ID=88552 /ORGANISM="Amoebophrya sp., Strain Ameob2" /LENGTH=1148 /DNA_ID=CAMNT_0020683101 /DNA_START=650 /DNA_END=4096 /DNA_ORIENTATION=+
MPQSARRSSGSGQPLRLVAGLHHLAVYFSLDLVGVARGNWLLSCSSCVDQTYFADEKLKDDVSPANTQLLLEQIKRLQVQSYTHKEDEFFNKFFNRTQLGILAQDLREVMPEAVALVPERRWTNQQGASMVNKDVLMIRDAHLLFSAVGGLNHLAHEFDATENVVEQHTNSLRFVTEEQELNKKKREDIMEQLLRTIATTEVLAKALQSTEIRFSELETHFALLKADSTASTEEVKKRIAEVEGSILSMKEVLKKEAHADLVEKRKRSETDLEKTKVLKEIEELRYTEEQKTIKLKEKEKKESEAAIIAMHKEKIKFEQEKKLDGDLQTIKAQELSNLRQLSEKAKHEKEMKELEVSAQKFKAEQELKQAIEAAKIEQEAKIKEIRENEDVHAREQKMKLEGQKQQVIVAIQATARIVTSWLHTLYGSSQNMMYALVSFLAVMVGVYFTREMATLLREQLNKRLGRPSLVRITSKKTRLGETWRLLKNVLTCCLCRKRAGHEFDDVVLHKRLEDQIFRLANATKNAKARGMPLLHIMFYGPPGTGKTMCAQRFAEYSGLEYAFMSGADVAPLEEQAVTELHKLFTWVHKSRKGVLLFIDEADAFLAVRNKSMSESLRNALTTMLYHTGTPTSQFLMVLATNRPGDLDPAVLDRIDESVEFGLPDLAERERMVFQYFNMYVTKPLKIRLAVEDAKPQTAAAKGAAPAGRKGQSLAVDTSAALTSGESCVDGDALKEVSVQLKTFSGREIAKLFTGLQTHICAGMRGAALRTRSLKLTKKTLFEVVKNKVEEHHRTLDVLARGYAYVHKEGSVGSPSLPATPLGLSRGSQQGVMSASGTRHLTPAEWQSSINININNSNQQALHNAGVHTSPAVFGGNLKRGDGGNMGVVPGSSALCLEPVVKGAGGGSRDIEEFPEGVAAGAPPATSTSRPPLNTLVDIKSGGAKLNALLEQEAQAAGNGIVPKKPVPHPYDGGVANGSAVVNAAKVSTVSTATGSTPSATKNKNSAGGENQNPAPTVNGSSATSAGTKSLKKENTSTSSGAEDSNTSSNGVEAHFIGSPASPPKISSVAGGGTMSSWFDSPPPSDMKLTVAGGPQGGGPQGQGKMLSNAPGVGSAAGGSGTSAPANTGGGEQQPQRPPERNGSKKGKK